MTPSVNDSLYYDSWAPSTAQPEPEPEQRTPETIDTQNSYATVPELSEPTKQFSTHYLNKRNQKLL